MAFFLSETAEKGRVRGTIENMEELKKEEQTPDGVEIPFEKKRMSRTPEQLIRKNRNLKIVFSVFAVLSFLLGMLVGTLNPLPYGHAMKDGLNSISRLNSKEKFQSVLDIMSQDWFFAGDIENTESRLTDQALYGMTKNGEDPHTSYMSAEEISSFTQSINRNFVGIGVQYVSTADGMFVIERVFRNSPAEKAGVLPGDIIRKVDDTSVEGKTSSDIVDMVRGEAGTTVKMEFERAGQPVSMTIKRAEITSTVFGEVKPDGIGYLQIAQFGESTAQEARAYLDSFKEEHVERLIIDLRGDGGGYLDSLRAVASLFLPGDKVVLQQVYSDGRMEETRTVSGISYHFSPIVILVDENTASAAEVFTLAIKENRDDVTTVGQKTYGKGTVQITRYFDDGSALKYTTSKWISSKGVWVNQNGIDPDEAVALPSAVKKIYKAMEDETEVRENEVSEFAGNAAAALAYLGYPVDRTDGYFSSALTQCIRSFQSDVSLPVNGILDVKTYQAIVSRMVLDWNTNKEKDTQLQRALEIVSGKESSGMGSEMETDDSLPAVRRGSKLLYEPVCGDGMSRFKGVL